MKILYLSFANLPSRAANSIHVMKMCQAFASYGHTVCLLAPDNGQDIDENEIFNYYGVRPDFTLKKVAYPQCKGKDILNMAMVAWTIRRFKPDLVYGRHLPYCFLGTRLGFSTIFEAHGPVNLEHKTGRYYFDFLIKSRFFLKIVVISSALKTIYQQKFAVPEDLLHVAHDGADLINSNMVVSPWPGRKGCLQVGYSGHLYKGRGIEIIAQLAQEFPSIDFHIAGGTEEDLLLWQKKLRIENLFFHGFVQPNKIDDWRSMCDILLAPYQKNLQISDKGENTSSFMSPLKIFEYMAAGKAIISSDLPVLKEVLNDSNAILVSPTNIGEWIVAIEKLQDDRTRSKLAVTAYNDLKNNYTWKTRAQDILACHI